MGNTVGDIGAAVQRLVEANGFSVVREFVGHGIGTRMHEDPQVPNYGTPGAGRSCATAWCWRSSRWSTPAGRERGCWKTSGRL